MKFTTIILTFLFVACARNSSDSDSGSAPVQEVGSQLSTEVLLQMNDVIWGFDFRRDGVIFFSERSGHVFSFDPVTKATAEVTGVPAVFAQGEGGLLDLRIQDNEIYLCYAQPKGGNLSTTSLGKGLLSGNTITGFTTIFEISEPQSTLNHFGCRIEFGSSGEVYLSTGERLQRTKAQDPASQLGKILVMNPDGSQMRVFTLGHRNVEGLAFRPGTDELWASELGPTGGDEFNHIIDGQNYGWPIISHGTDSGGLIQAESRDGFMDPAEFWVPSISPSALAWWNGDAYLACLSGQQVRRLILNGDNVIGQELLFKDLGWRFRNLRPGPDGNLYFSTDEGRLGIIHKAP